MAVVCDPLPGGRDLVPVAVPGDLVPVAVVCDPVTWCRVSIDQVSDSRAGGRDPRAVARAWWPGRVPAGVLAIVSTY